MKCNNCGFENKENAEYCVNCGTLLKANAETPVEQVSLNPAADIVMCALRDKLFLVLCVLMTISCLLSMSVSGLPLLNILITIFLWLTYADAQKGFANEKHLQFISGTVYANYVIMNVTGIIVLVCGLLFGVLFKFGGYDDPGFINELLQELEREGLDVSILPEVFFNLSGIIIGVICTLVGVLVLLINVLCIRKIHRFAKSVYMGIMYQNISFENPTAVKNWFIFMAVCSGISALGSITAGTIALLTSACSTAIMIIVTILIDRHFCKQMF